MKIEHDKRHDVIYFAFSSEGATRQVRLDAGRLIDYGEDGAIVGVEFLRPSQGISLAGVPHGAEIEDEARRLGLRIQVPATAA